MTETKQFPVPADTTIVSAVHELGTEDVHVRCERADGTAVGYAAAVPISAGEVEVVLVPDSGAATVYVTAAEAPAPEGLPTGD